MPFKHGVVSSSLTRPTNFNLSANLGGAAGTVLGIWISKQILGQ